MEEMSRVRQVRCLSRRELLAAVLLFAFFCLLTPRAVGAHVARLEPRDLAAASPHIVVAAVEKGETRWNEQRTLLFTDYTLRVEDRLRGEAPERVLLAMPGGTLGSISDDTCLTVRLERGARYLLFLGDLERPSLTPVVGAWQGAFRETRDRYAAAGASRTPMRLEGRPVRFRDLVAAVRTLARETPLASRAAALADASLPAKAWNPSTQAAGALKPIAAPFVYRERAVRPILVNPLLPGPFSPADQDAMAYWNLYAGDLFRVSPAPTAQWAFGNRVFDLAGFPDEKQMQEQFNVTWGEFGSGILGVAFLRRENGVIIEADVALNPARPWTLDDGEATTRGAAYSFKEVMIHELGHTWGLKHPFETQEAWWDSVMQYKSKVFHLGTICADDAAAVRSAFPPGAAIRDGLVSSYSTRWEPFAGLPTYTAAVPKVPRANAGGSFKLSGAIKVENVGTVPLVNLKVEVYLVPQRFTFEGAVLVKRVRLQGSLDPGATRQVSVGKVQVPGSLPAGTYYLAYYLRDPKDAYPANNGAWSNADVTLAVK